MQKMTNKDDAKDGWYKWTDKEYNVIREKKHPG